MSEKDLEILDFEQKRQELINLEGKGILPFKIEDIDEDEMSFVIYELDDYPETQKEIKELFHREVKYRKSLL
jgi:hypothetical protein